MNRLISTYRPSTSSVSLASAEGIRFNAKEKDYESGYHYYGARYYWSELLTGWLSVDPMMDKYPSISPYAYCNWNPVILVDPDGKKIKLVTGTDDEGNAITVDVNSISDFPDDERMNIIREMYKTEEGKNAIDKIMESEMVFTILEKMEGIEDHEVSPDGDVSWGNPSENHGGDAKHVLTEELYHCFQIATKKWKFDGSMSKDDMYDCEIKAKTFAASLFSYNAFWRHPDGSYIPTQMYIMDGSDYNLKKSYLQKDVPTTLPRYFNNPTLNPMEQPCGEYLHRGAYQYK